MSIPQDLVNLAATFNYQVGVEVDFDLDAFFIITRDYHASVPLSQDGYRKIRGMNGYVSLHYGEVPVASYDYIDNLSRRYVGSMDYLIAALSKYTYFDNEGNLRWPDAIISMVRCLGQNKSLIRNRYDSMLLVVKNNNFPGADPLPDIEKNM